MEGNVKEKSIRKSLTIFIISLFCVFYSAGISHAKDVSLTWTHSTSMDVAGYLLYYKSRTSGPPYEGVGAMEGDSPIDVGYTTNFTIHDLEDGPIYFFVLKAYDYDDNMSVYSNEATTARGLPPGVLLLLLN